MTIPMGELLERLNAPATRRLCAERDLPTGGRQEDRIASITRSLHGDVSALIGMLNRAELVRALWGTWRTSDGRGYTFTYLGQTIKADLQELAEKVAIKGWQPADDRDRPLPSTRIGVTFEYEDDGREDGAEDQDGDGEEEIGEDQLLAMTHAELVHRLSALRKTTDGRSYWLTYVRQTNKAELLSLATKVLFEGWEPLNDGDTPMPRTRIAAAFLDEDEREGDESGEFEDSEEELDEPDVDDEQRNFRSAAYQDELSKEFAYALHHRGEERVYQQAAARKLFDDMRADQPQLLHVATGGGKTRIVNDVVTRLLEEGRGPVLWVTKDWRLLWQAARDRSRRNPTAFVNIGRMGGDGTVLHPLPARLDADVVYTTLQTVGRDGRLASVARKHRPKLVVWDECHWGEHAALGGRLLKWCARNAIPVVGLTATPRSAESSRFEVSYSAD